MAKKRAGKFSKPENARNPVAAATSSERNRSKTSSESGVSAEFISSPITFGAKDHFYSFNLDAFKQTPIYSYVYGGKDLETAKQYRAVVKQAQNSLADSSKFGANTFIQQFQQLAGRIPTYKAPYDYTFYYNSNNTSFGASLRGLEDKIGTQTFAGRAANYSIWDPYGYLTTSEWWADTNRPSKQSLAKDLAEYALPRINEKGVFTNLLEYAPNGFLLSIGNDLDIAWDDEINAGDYNLESKSARKLSTYWPERLGEDHPLRDIYNLFYSKTGKTYWTDIMDLDGSSISAPQTSIYDDYFESVTGQRGLELGDAKITLLGPISNTTIKAGKGDKIVAASPVMTPVIHRQRRLSDEDGDENHEFRADTVLYPSSVGAFGTNKLELGNGDNIVYYDSSFKKIASRKGDQVFLPSFGAFNWSIDWIPGVEISQDEWSKPSDNWLKLGSSSPPLISPIPWDDELIDPKDGKDGKGTKKSYAEMMSEFAESPERGNLQNQKNYLYTIFSKLGNDGDSDEFSRTYLNLRPDIDGEDPLISRNPVNRLGGVKIIAGELSNDRGASNYSVPTGDKTFFGMDWELWQHLLPQHGSTLANNPAGTNNQKRAAQHQWHTVTLAGGRGNNTFNLGNITDNITNNGLFYPDDASYKISLTHDDYYSPQEILDEGIGFGNIYNTGDEKGSAVISTVNLSLQAEPNSYSVMVQTADPGEKGRDFFKDVTPWMGLAGYTQKLLKTPLDVQKEVVENWSKKIEDLAEKKGKINLQDTFGSLINDNEERKEWGGTPKAFDYTIYELEKRPSGKKWYDSTFGKGAKALFGVAFPWLDLASSTISTVKGLIEFFSAKEATPPRQELSTTFKEQGLSTGRKAVLINDWNPYAKINLNIPSFSPSDWDALSLAVRKPDTVSSGNNTNKGAYLELTYTSSNNSKTSQVDHPLVILENLDKNDRVDRVQKDGGGFAYYTYSFVDPDGNSGELIGGEFNPIRSSSLRLFGQLANPRKLLEEDGSPIKDITFPDDYVYLSENNFDMRNDAANYAAFANQGSGTGVNHYSRYYMGIQPSTKGLPSNWSMSANLSPFTSNVSLEFDSRTHGWYWQPVLKTATEADGSLDVATMVNPSTQGLDYNASRLWINDPNDGWISFSFNQLERNVAANRYSRLATTFYATSTDKDRNGISDGQEQINERNKLNRQLLLLEDYVESLVEIDQRMLRDDLKLYSLNQIESVKTIKNFKYKGGEAEEACLVTFNSVNDNGQEVKRRLVLLKDGNQLMPAIAVDNDMQEITPSTFEFNVVVDPENPTQRAAFNPSDPNPELLIRSFSGVYNPKAKTTQLFEYVPFPKDDQDGLTFDEAREAARSRQLPSSLSTSESVSSYLATIDNAEENDAITGWFKGKAWLGADNMGDDEQIKDKEGLDLQEDHNIWQWLDGKNERKPFWIDYHYRKEFAKDGPIDDRYSNWAGKGSRWSEYTQVLTIDGETGSWEQAFSNLPLFSGINGYVVEYTPFKGLPSFV